VNQPNHTTPPPDGWDYVVVTTKALPDRADDSTTIAPLVGPRTVIVLIQNGVGVEDPYRRRFPRAPIVSAVTIVSAAQTSPGTVTQYRWTRIHMGPYTDSASSSPPPGSANDRLASQTKAGLTRRAADAVAFLSAELSAGGIRDAEGLDEAALQAVRWHKLTINAAFNPASILCGGQTRAEMVTDSALRAFAAGVMQEIWDAAPAVLGAPFSSDMAAPERILRSVERAPGAKPSMLQDWEVGRPLELEVILGNPVRIAKSKGVELPRCEAMYALLRSWQEKRDAEGKETAKAKGKL
jgi:2-dehydropantoate 2-reductase